MNTCASQLRLLWYPNTQYMHKVWRSAITKEFITFLEHINKPWYGYLLLLTYNCSYLICLVIKPKTLLPFSNNCHEWNNLCSLAVWLAIKNWCGLCLYWTRALQSTYPAHTSLLARICAAASCNFGHNIDDLCLHFNRPIVRMSRRLLLINSEYGRWVWPQWPTKIHYLWHL